MRLFTSSDPDLAGWSSKASKLKALEDEIRKLKKLLADTMLDASTLKEMLGKTSDAQFAETCCDLGDQ
jgi:putative transposase